MGVFLVGCSFAQFFICEAVQIWIRGTNIVLLCITYDTVCYATRVLSVHFIWYTLQRHSLHIHHKSKLYTAEYLEMKCPAFIFAKRWIVSHESMNKYANPHNTGDTIYWMQGLISQLMMLLISLLMPYNVAHMSLKWTLSAFILIILYKNDTSIKDKSMSQKIIIIVVLILL